MDKLIPAHEATSRCRHNGNWLGRQDGRKLGENFVLQILAELGVSIGLNAQLDLLAKVGPHIDGLLDLNRVLLAADSAFLVTPAKNVTTLNTVDAQVKESEAYTDRYKKPQRTANFLTNGRD
jgi:hypothetical protein